MPVRKFRSVEEMNRPGWFQPGDPALPRAMAIVWEFGRHLRPPRPVGVFRFRSLEALRQAEDRLADENQLG
jgi:hypothetical protein